jgi:hypothetical protein
MKRAAAARQRNGSWGRQNMRQYLIVRCDPSTGNSDGPSLDQAAQAYPKEQPSAPADSTVNSRPRQKRMPAESHPLKEENSASVELTTLSRPMPLSGIDRVMSETNINILDLNELTHLHMGHAAGAILSSKPGLLHKLMGCRRDSFLAHVPARFGHTECLDDAVRCIALRAKRFLVQEPVIATETELSLYGKALKSLQAAVNDRTHWTSPDILCAVQILSFYEVLPRPSTPDNCTRVADR